MATLRIRGGKPLKGTLTVFGAKNAVLKQLAATLLAPGRTTLDNVPQIRDVEVMIEILTQLGASVVRTAPHTLSVDTEKVKRANPDAQLVKKMRASIVIAAPLVARFGEVVIAQPGGDVIGPRPIDTILDVFRQFGVHVVEESGKYRLRAKALKGTRVVLDELSVSATETALMLAVLAKGHSEIRVAAAEPEIEDLISLLKKMGAQISGANTHFLQVDGVEHLHPTTHTIIPDRLETGTFIALSIATRSRLAITECRPDHLDLVLKKMGTAGAQFTQEPLEGKLCTLNVIPPETLRAFSIDTRPYPGFPSDLQAQFATVMTQAKGESTIFETLYQNRFNYLQDFKRMGAAVRYVNTRSAIISGPRHLKGKHITSMDIRAGATLILAGLVALGETLIDGVEHIDRGYEHLEERLREVGADIVRISN